MNATERLADPGFGSYMLNGLREITLPELPSYRPQTIGWAILAGIALLGLALWSLQKYRIWHRNSYRRAALQRLAELEPLSQQPITQAKALKELSELLKRTALAAYPREQVAQLYGDAWLTFLESTYPGNHFTQGSGHLLSKLPYLPPEALNQLPAEAVKNLITTTRAWITTHQPPQSLPTYKHN